MKQNKIFMDILVYQEPLIHDVLFTASLCFKHNYDDSMFAIIVTDPSIIEAVNKAWLLFTGDDYMKYTK